MPSRRTFLKTSAATLAAAPFVNAHVGGTDMLKVGLVGCGGRGTGAAENAIKAGPNIVLWALADAFEEQIKSCIDTLTPRVAKMNMQTARGGHFVGLDAYKQLMDTDVDVVLLCSPPGFRPQHLRYAVEKKKQIFCEKPMAVDGPGVRSVLETAKLAKEYGLNIVAGFCFRYDLPKRETVKRIHDGAIGDVLAIHCNYLTGYLRAHERRSDWSDTEYQIRNWLYHTWLSGDHIVEQHIHNLDKAAWVLQEKYPIAAVSVGGRQTRVEPRFGHIFDHFATVFEYDRGVKVFSFCRQIQGCDTDVSDHIIGDRGAAHLMKHTIEPKDGPKWHYSGPAPVMYDQEHIELFEAIRSGKTINQGESMAHSTLMGVLGRMAGYTGKRVTWEQALNSSENLMPENLDMKASLPFAPVAKPGKTKFI